VVAPACVNQGPRRLSPVEQAFEMYWSIWDIWNPQTELFHVSPSWTIPYLLMDVIRDSAGPPTVCPSRHTRGRRHMGEVGPGPTL
jgi:hypothetical protein